MAPTPISGHEDAARIEQKVACAPSPLPPATTLGHEDAAGIKQKVACAPTPHHPAPVLAENAKLRIHLEDLTHEATASFVTLIDLSRVIRDAINNVQKYLYTPYSKPQAVRSVTLILRSMDGVAYTTGTELDNDHKEIHVSLSYLSSNRSSPTHFKSETIGVITHEMVHCFQQTCSGNAPGGLIEGIADYVRLRAGLAPTHWTKFPAGPDTRGKKWDEGYQRTAWFLEWLDHRFGAGSVVKLNARMGQGKYDEKLFWTGLFDMTIEKLWAEYEKSWKDDSDGDGDEKLDSSASSKMSEPELVDLSEREKAEADLEAKEEKKGRGKKAQEFIA